MKEYTEKKDVLNTFENNFRTSNVYVQDAYRAFKELSTVTKSDICKEIAEELCEQWNIDSLCSISNTEQMRIWIKNKLLKIAEMENEE